MSSLFCCLLASFFFSFFLMKSSASSFAVMLHWMWARSSGGSVLGRMCGSCEPHCRWRGKLAYKGEQAVRRRILLGCGLCFGSVMCWWMLIMWDDFHTQLMDWAFWFGKEQYFFFFFLGWLHVKLICFGLQTLVSMGIILLLFKGTIKSLLPFMNYA